MIIRNILTPTQQKDFKSQIKCGVYNSLYNKGLIDSNQLIQLKKLQNKKH
ncbi:MAG: hypothetical protein U0M12_05570 [Acutalibacteraceae bacterium]|nr:hypothetical protein [Acutalibacteraceae bacterium]MEE0929478.1 hypothetical protein [Acutalibacteraceae bacterium]